MARLYTKKCNGYWEIAIIYLDLVIWLVCSSELIFIENQLALKVLGFEVKYESMKRTLIPEPSIIFLIGFYKILLIINSFRDTMFFIYFE